MPTNWKLILAFGSVTLASAHCTIAQAKTKAPASATASTASYYTQRPDDPIALDVTPEKFGVKADGTADDTDAIQKAINTVQETRNQGIVLIPSGRYRVTHTIYVWPGIRLIGYGPTRPTFVLAPHTPGFDGDEDHPQNMVFFSGGRPQNNAPPRDATPGTFYSAMSNIDIEIGDGNPGAVGIRSRFAQHCYLAHVDFRLGSGLAGIHDGGNFANDLHFHQGKYGIWTRKPSPGWQLTILDATFDHQREAAIREHEAGLTLIRPVISDVPTAIEIDPKYADELFVKDARLKNISGPAFIISNENSPRTEINMEGISCDSVASFASFRESNKQVASPAKMYRVKSFSHGLHYKDMGAPGEIEDVFDTEKLSAPFAPAPSDIRSLPPMSEWFNVRSAGATGDATTDDTAAIQKAIAEHTSVYFPAGQYRVTDTIALKPDTILIGLHPSTTRIILADGTPAFQGVGDPKPLIDAPANGTNVITGIGLYTNGINPRAVAAKWAAGETSMLYDVRFLGGHGTIDPTVSAAESRNSWRTIYNNTHTADTDINRRWDSQYPSLWVTGGGTFVGLWTPSTFAQAGLYISNTSTPGRVYELSSEHHVRNEVVLDHVSNWQFYALQTEEERGESGFCLPLDIRNSSNITLANLHMYRVVSSYQPFPYAIKITNSRDIRLRNIHIYSDAKVSFDNAVYDQTHDVQLRQREFAYLTYSGDAPKPATAAPANNSVLAPGAKVEKLTTGFFNISGGAVDPTGNPYFVDARKQTIYKWDAASNQLATVRDNPLDPVNLFFDKAGTLNVVSYAGNGTVYTFQPSATNDNVTLLKSEPGAARTGLTAILPVDYWRNENDFLEAIAAKKPYQFVSPDGSTFLPAGNDFVSGELYYGTKMADVVRAFGLMPAPPAGQRVFITNEDEQNTYSATVDDSGALSDVKLFLHRGGEGLAIDAQGNVYIAAGQIYVYNPAGELIDTIDVPERPSQLLFGGANRDTLYILARSSLYSVRTRYKGR
jgi:sugar lactone lactonase YvrE